MEHQGSSWRLSQPQDTYLPTTYPSDLPYDDGSDASSESSYDPTTVMAEPQFIPKRSDPKKRKSTEPNSPFERHHKRLRFGTDGEAPLSDASIQLPAEVWHHIFTFLPPPTLGKLLLVNKLFNTYLDPASKVKAVRPVFPEPRPQYSTRPRRSMALHPMLPETIWRSSRRVFLPAMPTPLRTKSELDSWRLACSKTCQFCGFRSQEEAKDLWHRGPGAKGVSPVFPLLMLTCGACLAANTVKVGDHLRSGFHAYLLQEVDMLLSSAMPSVLLPALPAALVTPAMHVIASQTLRMGSEASGPDITKLYSKEQINELKTEFDGVKVLGSGAAEEWFKGLDAKGKSLSLDAARWEKWETGGGLQRMRQMIKEAQSLPTAAQKPANTRGSSAQTERNVRNGFGTGGGSGATVLTMLSKAGPSESANPPNRNQRKRTKQEAMELMRKRREEIERRAALLSPPITPTVLAHMPSFQAAVQISTPLDDDAWGVLTEKFSEQRDTAERKCHEQNRLATAMASNGRASVAVNGEVSSWPEPAIQTRDPREVPDSEWDDVQGPVRAKISNFADEIIRDEWDDGEKVNRKTSPSFAAGVLLYVRRRFYEEAAKEQAVAMEARQPLPADPPEGPWLQKLTLENMKWVFDVKVKPFTNKLRPELFLCHGCSNAKWFGLEGVIQHYAAKHTKNLSLGNVVVFWRAEWPEVPPFMPDPKNPKTHDPLAQTTQPNPQFAAPSSTTRLDLTAKTAATPAPGENGNVELATFSGTSSPHRTLLSHHTSQPLPHSPQNTYPFHAPPAQGALAQMQHMLSDVFHILPGVEIPLAVKLCTVIHHVAKRWQREFNESPPFAEFCDCLRPHDWWYQGTKLRCKACGETSGSGSSLAAHFEQKHTVDYEYLSHLRSTGAYCPESLDWRTEMVALPPLEVLYNLPRLLAHNVAAFDLVADALPWAFDAPPPPTAYNDARSQPDYHRQGTELPGSLPDSYDNPTRRQSRPELGRASAGFWQDARASTPQAHLPGQHILDDLESQLDKSQQVQPLAAPRAVTRAPETQGFNTTRGEYPRDSYSTPHEQQQYYEYSPYRHHYPRQPPQHVYRGSTHVPEGDYEVLEARDPGTGALYHIRRRVQREPYQQVEGSAQALPPQDYHRAGTVAPPPAGADMEDYDPRYPAGTGPARY